MATDIRPTLVLDLDGTLADTAPDLVTTLNVILAQEGYPAIGLEKVRSMMGAGAKALLVRGLAAAGDTVSPAHLEKLYGDFIAYYHAHIADHSVLFPGALDSLDRFADAGWSLAVCTNKLEGLARHLLTELDIAGRFDAICGGDTFGYQKPDPRHLIDTIARAGGSPRAAVMVGDSVTDINAARAAAVPVVGMTFGYTMTPIADLNPDAVLDHFSDLYDTAHRLLDGAASGH